MWLLVVCFLHWVDDMSGIDVFGSLHDNEPMQADEPPIVRGDAPRGLFAPRWEEVRQTHRIERPRGFFFAPRC